MRFLTCLFLLSFTSTVLADHHEGWVSMFNGKTLAGWTQKNGTATYEVRGRRDQRYDQQGQSKLVPLFGQRVRRF